jgi:tetratricopeptide (TPR) repeat protein
MTDRADDVLRDLVWDSHRAAAEHVECDVLARLADVYRRAGLPQPPVHARASDNLPPTGPDFVGRNELLHRLRVGGDRILLTGLAGVGKTTVAVRYAHEMAAQFHDGVLYAQLNDSSPTRPTSVGALLAGLLRQLGADDVPPTLAEKRAAFRSMTTDRELLVVLDGAVSEVQVASLLPASRRSAVIVTSRYRDVVMGMDGFQTIAVQPMETEIAVEMLRGAAPTKDPHALAAVVAACEGIPLALKTAASYLADRGHWTATRLAAALERERVVVAPNAWRDGCGAIFDVCYRGLDHETARAYRLLALWDGPDFDGRAAAVLLDRSPAVTAEVLGGLVMAGLLHDIGKGRSRFDNLLRTHGRRSAERDSTNEDCVAALDRMVCYYRDYLIARDKVLSSRPRACDDLYRTILPADRASALTDLEVERGNFVAAVLTAHSLQHYDYAWQLCVAIFPFAYLRGHHEDLIEAHVLGVEAAQRQANLPAEIQLRHQLGAAFLEVESLERARKTFECGLGLARRSNHRLGEQSALEWLGLVHERAGEYERALSFFDAAGALAATVGQRRSLAVCRMHSGRVLVEIERAQEAIGQLELAMAFFLGGDEAVLVAEIAASLASAYQALDRREEAVAVLEQTLDSLTRQGMSDSCKLLVAPLRRLEQRPGRISRERQSERLNRRWRSPADVAGIQLVRCAVAGR